MNILLVVGLLASSLGLGLGLLGGLRRSPSHDATVQALPPAERPAAETTDNGFVFPASDATTDGETNRGVVFPARGQRTVHHHRERADEAATVPRTGVPGKLSSRDHTTEALPTRDASSETTLAINIVEDCDEWITAWQRTVNTESTYAETGAEWGVEFNGNILFEVEPDDAYAAVVQETTANSSDGIIFFAELSDGAVHSATPIASDERDQYEYGFTYHGSYSNWKALITQEIGPIEGLLSGQFAVEGDMQTVLQWSDGLVDLVSSAGHIETVFPDEPD